MRERQLSENKVMGRTGDQRERLLHHALGGSARRLRGVPGAANGKPRTDLLRKGPISTGVLHQEEDHRHRHVRKTRERG